MTRGFIIILGLMVAGCTPYKTFYKETVIASKGIPSQNVYRLTIDGNLPFDVAALPTLDKLALLKLSALSPTGVDRILRELPHPEKLKVLILDSLHLNSLPPSLSRFTNLNHLSLSHNPTLSLDEALKSIKDVPITFLNLQYNQLSELPNSVVLLQHLIDINLSHNTIRDNKTFERLARLPKLRSLWLTSNELTCLPKNLGKLSQLRNLYIEHNQLTEIPDEVIGMEKVWVLHAGHNRFKELPANFAKMPSLILLHANNCEINTIPEVYDTKASSVLGLILDNNNISVAQKAIWKKKMSNYFLLSME